MNSAKTDNYSFNFDIFIVYVQLEKVNTDYFV
jgi:hypothetical protein